MAFLRISTTVVAATLFSTAAMAFEPIISLPGAEREIEPGGTVHELLVTKAATDGQLGMIVVGSFAGGGPGPSIVNSEAAEYWYVIDGTFRFHIGDKVFQGGPGTLVAADKGTPHGYVAITAGHVLTIVTPGGLEQLYVEVAETGASGVACGAIEKKYGISRPLPVSK